MYFLSLFLHITLFVFLFFSPSSSIQIIIAGLVIYRVASARASAQAAKAAALEEANKDGLDQSLIQDEAGGPLPTSDYEGMNDDNSMKINQ